MSLGIRLLAVITSLLGLGLILSACDRLPAPEQGGELVIGIREAPGFYQQEENGGSGFEHDLAIAFAHSMGLKPRLITAGSTAELTELLMQQRIHMASSMSIGAGKLEYSQSIRNVGHVIVGLADELGPESIEELPDHTVQVIAGSPLAKLLRELPTPPKVVEVSGIDEMELLTAIAADRNALAAVHGIHLDLASNFYPDLRSLIRLPGQIDFGWAFAGPAAASLKAKADTFIAEVRRDGTLARIHDRYFGHIKRINANNAAQFIDDIQTRLPDFRHHFHVAEELTGIDWRLLAALAYQESRWDPLAKSYTNVRGMMMLTGETADRLGVKNRLDAGESIRAGALYLLDLIEQIPATTPYPDRLWLGMAAYNLGMGHLRGGIAIAKSMNRNPDSWYEMKQVLPQLARPRIYVRLKSGKARGGEAVIMTENIRTYFDILARFEAPHITPFSRPLAKASTTVQAFDSIQIGP
jgi:membrane-bound lytic murein transglycosylase F